MSDYIYSQAMQILRRDDIITYVRETFNTMHVGDADVADGVTIRDRRAVGEKFGWTIIKADGRQRFVYVLLA